MLDAAGLATAPVGALGGVLVALHPGVLLAWSQSYWGGTVAAMGGALLFGAWRRIIHRPRVRDALLLGVGLLVLANSRPYEGMLVSLPMAVSLLVWTLGKAQPSASPHQANRVARHWPTRRSRWRNGTVQWRVTGNPVHTPYQVYEETYAPVPLFLSATPRPASQNIAIPSCGHLYIFADYLFREQRSLRGMAWMGWHKVKTYWIFYQGGVHLRLVFTFPLSYVPWLLREPVVTLRYAYLLGIGSGVAH